MDESQSSRHACAGPEAAIGLLEGLSRKTFSSGIVLRGWHSAVMNKWPHTFNPRHIHPSYFERKKNQPDRRGCRETTPFNISEFCAFDCQFDRRIGIGGATGP
ncbi:MAG: hypothetical protein ACLPPF_08095 [Rhodomicrobium sp.]